MQTGNRVYMGAERKSRKRIHRRANSGQPSKARRRRMKDVMMAQRLANRIGG